MELLIICIVAGVVVGGVAGFLIARRKNKKSEAGEATAGKVKVVDGVRYSENANIEDSAGNMSVTHNEGDVILAAGKTYKAEKGGALMPGKYTVLSAHGGVDTFNIRIGGFVREYKHGDELVIADGEEITAVSHTVVLR